MEVNEIISKFQEFVEINYQKDLFKNIKEGKRFLVIEFNELAKFNIELCDELLEKPEETLKAFELSLNNFDIEDVKDVRIRVKNLPQEQYILIKDIRSKDIGKFIWTEGVVRQKSDVRPQVTSARFECPSCGNIIPVLQLDKKFKEPSRCGCGRKGKFRLLSKELVDAQGLVLEEATKDLEGGAQPKRMNVFLQNDLVSPMSERKTNPGNQVRISGVIKEVPIILRTGGQSTKFDLMIETNYLEAVEEDYSNILISDEDEEQIKIIAEDPKIISKLSSALAPGIFGHDLIKEAMCLQFVGGVSKLRDDGVRNRGDIHMLLIGDPGCGKSQLLKRASVVAPKARYVSGKGVSGAGLTAAVVKDEFLSGWSLEAGALVLANKGMVMIDEMDKMSPEDRSAMHEALEQQSYHYDFEIMMGDGSKEKIGKLIDRNIEQNKDKTIQGKDCEILATDNINIITTDFKKTFVSKANRISRHLAPKYFYKIYYNNGRSIIVTPEHPLFVYSNGEIKETPACLAEKDMIVPAIRKINTKDNIIELKSIKNNHFNNKKIEFPNKLNKNLAKLLGYIVTEGHSYYNKKNRYAEIGISNTDKQIIEEVDQLFKKCFKTTTNINLQKKETRKKAKKDIFTVRCCSISLYKYFEENFGELILKAPLKRIPGSIMCSNKILKHNFLHTAFKGDGFVDSERCGYSTASKKLAEDYQDMLLQLGVWNYIAVEKRDDKKYYKVVISGEDSLVLFLKDIVKDDKRKNIVNNIKKIMNFIDSDIKLIRIKAVKKIKNKDSKWVYDVTVEPTKTFVSSGLVLHNTVSISKANIQATLRCETTVLAAANPKFGRFDPYDTVAKQIDLPPALINRFDLIFTLKDIPDEEKDKKMARFILEMHKIRGTEETDISTDLLRKYFIYAKQKISPRLTEEAIEEILEYYLKMRGSGASEDRAMRAIPISARQLEALVRLSEASAKLRLNKEVTSRDAKHAIALIHYCLEQVGMDPETGKIDIDRISTGITTSERSRIVTIREIINELEAQIGKNIPIEEVINSAKDKGIEEEKVLELIEKLKRSGDLFEPRRGEIQKI